MGRATMTRGSGGLQPRRAACSNSAAAVLADTDPGDTIPLASVPKEALDKTVEYMEKMAGFKADGTSDEDKQQWVSEYKKTMEAQDQLPLLFQTMTAANFMNVKTLLDELCKFVAEMIAQRTPNEILDYFNIKKDATWCAAWLLTLSLPPCPGILVGQLAGRCAAPPVHWRNALTGCVPCTVNREEEQELIATHKWIDPEGLIAKDREKRLAEKAKEQA